jgi:cyclopropane-fatty-acyl-phospholipid synthase
MKTSTAVSLDKSTNGALWSRGQRKLTERLFAPLNNAKTGHLKLTLPNGDQLEFGDTRDTTLRAQVTLKRWRALQRAVSGGSLGWSEAYLDGDWDSPDIPTVIEWALRNESFFGGSLEAGRLQSLLAKLKHRRNANSRRGSRRNIAYHYDLGNDFYKLWLDDSMSYSSGIYEDDNHAKDLASLKTAQYRKYQRLIDQLGITNGDSVLEIGCGWGGFAEQLLQQTEAQLHGITLSKEQLSFAQARLAEAGLQKKAHLSLTDYRDCEGQYDHIVSIEMMEAVGEAYWPTYFDTLYRNLKPGGRAAIQVITIDHQRLDGYRNTPDFIQRYIFPGGMLPSPELFREHAQARGFSLRDEFSFGQSYATTLAAWDQAFRRNWEYIKPQGFDQRFYRMWRYYLAYCEGGFRGGSIDVYQFVLEKPAA